MATTSVSSTTSTPVSLAVSGLASGFDWQSLISQLIAVERQPETLLQQRQTNINNQNIAYGSLVTELEVLKNKADALADPSLFASRVTQVSDTTVASATASSGATLASYAFNISHLATTSVQQGGGDIGGHLSATNDVSGLTLSNAPFATPITAGTFTVNGQIVTIATSDTLQKVFDKISTATVGTVTGSYDSGTDKITLTSASPIVLGSATDTSNFLQAAQLNNNGTGTVTSRTALGAVQLTATLGAANLATAITDGGSGAGAFTINGVTINFNASTDTLAGIINKINESAAGVVATYDSLNDRLVLTNQTTGDLGISLHDVTGNFLAATKLSSGTLQRGNDLVYSINGGDSRTSHSNTITESSSGITGLSVTALKGGTTTITVGSDTATIKTAITNFVDEYNTVQSLIQSDTAITIGSDGTTTTSVLSGDQDIANIATNLRSSVYGQITGLSGTIDQLADLGYATNGNDNTIALTDSTALDNALATNLSGVQDLFSNATKGLAATLSSTLDNLAGDNGSLVNHQGVLTQQSTDIDNQIAAMERLIQADQQRMTDEFVAMEEAQAQINQQLTYLTQATTNSTNFSAVL
ncbi:MAG TPA: flagellar filament capping protein FliD [Verrucomicrobiae bacterium]|nr:flagellar filament capping protein FliD [Verrucomicrobiae bacterium]